MLRTAIVCLVIAILPLPSSAWTDSQQPLQLAMKRAEADNKTTEAEAPRRNSAAPAPAPIVWKPPVEGAPAQRVAGGVRGNVALAWPTALVPEQLGLTSRAAPSLFWHLDATTPKGVRFFFTLNDLQENETVREIELERPSGPGIQRLRLADHDIELTPAKTYSWTIALVPNIDDRSRDRLTQGSIERRPWPRDWTPDAAHFAAFGYWYDALETLSNKIAAQPEDEIARAQRQSLLDQARLQIAGD